MYLSPEGMRVTTGEIGHFNKGSFHLATSLHAQIVPIYFAIPREINPGMGYDAKPGLIDVYFLPPIDTSRWVLADLERNRDAVRDLFVRVHDSMRATGRLPESLTIDSGAHRSRRGARMSAAHKSLVDLLRARSAEQGSDVAFTFLVDGEHEGPRCTFAELDARARAVASALRERGVRPGDRALLLYPPGLDFIPAFFGCLYAGVVAVPAYPPQPSQASRTLPRLLSIVGDAEVAIVLANANVVDAAARMMREAPGLGSIPWLATDSVSDDRADEWRDVAIAPRRPRVPPVHLRIDRVAARRDGLARQPAPQPRVRQSRRRSGSLDAIGLVASGDPRHGAHRGRARPRLRRIRRRTSWRPRRFSTGRFDGFAPSRATARRRAAGRTSRTISASAKSPTRSAPSWTSSSWRAAYNGAEPIRAETLEAFHARFKDVGFRWRSFYPVYGLAESTLLVSTGGRDYEPVIHDVVQRRVDARAPEARSPSRFERGHASARVERTGVVRHARSDRRSGHAPAVR